MNSAALRDELLDGHPEHIHLCISPCGQPIDIQGFMEFVRIPGKKYESLLLSEKELKRWNQGHLQQHQHKPALQDNHSGAV